MVNIVSLKRPWVGKRCFFLSKLTYIALCKFSWFWLRFSPFWGNVFKDLLIWFIIGWQVCILGWVSDKYSYLLKPCCNYICKVSIIFEHFQKVIYLCSRNLRKKPNFDLSENHEYTFLWRVEIFYMTNIMPFIKFAQKICFYLLVASLYLIQSKSKIFIHSFISCRPPSPNEWFQVELFWRKYKKKLYFRI